MQGQLGLQSEFQDIEGYIEKPYLEKPRTKQKGSWPEKQERGGEKKKRIGEGRREALCS